MGKRKKTLVERTYKANVFTDAALSRIESLDGTNLMPQNTDFEQLKSLSGPGEDLDSPDRDNGKEPT
ncbi:MAG TPA: hypothetical protein VFF83_06660 [Clostridia bacterium]|nr:hypothetical protein [Clostridia bacterium]